MKAKNMLTRPRIENPRLFKDGVAWLRVFHARNDRIEPPFYGINLFQVKRRKLVKAITRLLQLAAPGLTGGFGEVRALKFFPDAGGETYTAVLIFQWNHLPEIKTSRPPLEVIHAHFAFMASVEAYNWTLVKELTGEPEDYAKYLYKDFHSDICKPAS